MFHCVSKSVQKTGDALIQLGNNPFPFFCSISPQVIWLLLKKLPGHLLKAKDIIHIKGPFFNLHLQHCSTGVKLLYTQVLALTVCEKWSGTVGSSRNMRKMGGKMLLKSTSLNRANLWPEKEIEGKFYSQAYTHLWAMEKLHIFHLLSIRSLWLDLVEITLKALGEDTGIHCSHVTHNP